MAVKNEQQKMKLNHGKPEVESVENGGVPPQVEGLPFVRCKPRV